MKFSYLFKSIIGILVLSVSLSSFAKKGTIGGGGGGKKEPVFEDIAINIAKWIVSGNAEAMAPLLQHYGFTLDEYKTEMLKVLNNYQIAFTDDKVTVNGSEKTCRGVLYENQPSRILCNNTQFGDETPENINEIYRHVHHEIASLACFKKNSARVCLEENIDEKSDYRFSKFVSAKLEPAIVMRLPEILQAQVMAPENVACVVGGEEIDFNGQVTKLQERLFFSSDFVLNQEPWLLYSYSSSLSLEGKLQPTNVPGISVFVAKALWAGRTVRYVGETHILMSKSGAVTFSMKLENYGKEVGRLDFSCRASK